MFFGYREMARREQHNAKGNQRSAEQAGVNVMRGNVEGLVQIIFGAAANLMCLQGVDYRIEDRGEHGRTEALSKILRVDFEERRIWARVCPNSALLVRVAGLSRLNQIDALMP